MGDTLSKYVDEIINVTDSKNGPKIITIAPNYNSGEVDSSLDRFTLIPKLLEDSKEKLKSKDYKTYLSLLQRASNLGSGLAAEKLGYLYLHGFQDDSFSTNINEFIISPNYELSADYYFSALKIIKFINYVSWDMNLLLDVLIGLTELYRFHFNRENDIELWDNGLTILKEFETILNELQFIKFQTHENNQIRNAIRIHILFILALTYELDQNYIDAMNVYNDCEKIGLTTISPSADTLIKKSHTRYRLLENDLNKKTPKVLPICVECSFEPKDKREAWKLLICPKCQSVACCTRQCLQLHIVNDH